MQVFGGVCVCVETRNIFHQRPQHIPCVLTAYTFTVRLLYVPFAKSYNILRFESLKSCRHYGFGARRDASLCGGAWFAFNGNSESIFGLRVGGAYKRRATRAAPNRV